VTSFIWNDNRSRPAWQQMAIDRALAARAVGDGAVVFRLYRWSTSSVSFGANEQACRTWNRPALDDAGIPCVRRPTGGRGVWHDADDLTYAVTGPAATLGGLRLAYRVIHEQLAAALAAIGLAATIAPRAHRPTLAPGSCFDLAVGGEVLVDGRKTIGSAQALIGGAILQHGAIARADRGGALARFRLPSGSVDRSREGRNLPDHATLARAIVDRWFDEGGCEIPGGLVAWAEEASASHADQFRDPLWTWRR
jgi:lipoate-protein ligase A